MEERDGILEAINGVLAEVRELQKKDYVTKEVNELNLKNLKEVNEKSLENLKDNIAEIKEHYTKKDVFWKWIVGLGGTVAVGIIVCIVTHFLK